MKALRLPDRKKCCGCGACRASCPKSAIVMRPDEDGFLQPVVDAAKCVDCGKCEEVCPVLHHGKPHKPLAVYAAKAKDDELRRGSASGGMFTILAQETLKRGGVVFGVGFEHSTWRVVHKAATNLEELDDLRGSKYVQSDTGNTFKEAKRHLEAGREVLYSGCPCQIAAFKNFLGKDYPNLLMVDIICHGVPSPLVWQKYLDCREREANSSISRILPRRYSSWRDFSIKIEFERPNSENYSKCWNEDFFMQGYYSYWGLRACCHQCAFRTASRYSDLTIGDYLLVDGVRPGFGDVDGVSMVLVNTDRGGRANEDLVAASHYFPIDYECAIQDNPPIQKNPSPSRLRKEFFRRLSTESYDDLAKALLQRRKESMVWHTLWWLKRLIINRELNRFRFR